MFQTSTYMSDCTKICLCVCSGAYLHRCMYMSRTHDTHIHAQTTHTCLGLYVCIFWDYVKGSLYVRRALHCTDLLLLGQSWNWRCWRAQLFVTERTGGYNILMSGWAPSYFSLGSVRIVFILGICSPLLGCCPSCFESICASERGLCARQRCSTCQGGMTYVARALFV